jgi:hypothetical protein
MNEEFDGEAGDEPVPLALIEQSLGAARETRGPTAGTGPWAHLSTVELPLEAEPNEGSAVGGRSHRSDMEVDG